jgi:hypothetical protein
VFHRFSAHDGLFFKFQRPSFITYIKNDHIHSQVLAGNLSAQPRAHAWIKKQATYSFIFAELFIPERIRLIVQRLFY